MATVVRASIRDILTAIKAELVLREVLGEDAIHFVARDYVPHFVADKDLLLRPGRVTSSEPWNTGAGRAATALKRYLHCICRTRLALDESDRDEKWLQDEAFGHWILEESVLDALQDFLPEDADENVLLIEPMRVVDADAPDKDRKEPLLWGESTVTFEVFYAADIDATR